VTYAISILLELEASSPSLHLRQSAVLEDKSDALSKMMLS